MGFKHPDYTVIKELGYGAGGVVYLAVQNSLNRRVAVKVFNAPFARDGASQRFQREAHILAQLDHPHIVPVYELSALPDEQGYLLTMAYIDGGTLRQRAADFSLRQALTVVRQIADALGYAHASGFIHRDVKPDNILFQNDQAMLADFGIARATDSETRMTQHGAVLGTPEYMSPEQVNGNTVDGRSDLYSLGIVLYELLTGQPPFKTDSAIATGIQQVTATAEPLPPAFSVYQAMFDRLLAKTKEHRHASASELVAELDRATEQLPWPVDDALHVLRSQRAKQQPAPLLPPHKRRFAGPVARASIVLLLLLALLTWFLQQRSDDTAQLPTAADATAESGNTATTAVTAENSTVTVQPAPEQQQTPVSQAVLPPVSNPTATDPQELSPTDTDTSSAAIDTAAARQAALREELSQANLLWQSGIRFTGDPNAVSRYKDLLRQYPEDQTAADTLEDIFSRTYTDAGQAVSDGQLDSAAASLQDLKKHWPDDARLPALESSIETARQREREAARLLSQQRAKEQRLQTLLDDARAAERANRLLEPAANNALFYYRKILQEDVSNTHATSALKQIKHTLLQRVKRATDAGEVDTAASQLSALDSHYPNDQAIARARAQLNAKTQQLESQQAAARELAAQALNLDASVFQLERDIAQWMTEPAASAITGHSDIQSRIEQLQRNAPQHAALAQMRVTVAQHLSTLTRKPVTEPTEILEDTFNMPGF